MTRIRKLENEGRFEGFVGNDPEFIENKKGNPQCFLHVGQTPRWLNPETGKWTDLRTIWVHFAVFGPPAEVVVDHVKKGMRVEVKYKLVSRFHPRWKEFTGFEAQLIRPIANAFKKKDDPLAAWKPDKPKKGGSWAGDQDYAKMGIDALRAEIKKRELSVEGTGLNGRVLADDMRGALRKDDDEKLAEKNQEVEAEAIEALEEAGIA